MKSENEHLTCSTRGFDCCPVMWWLTTTKTNKQKFKVRQPQRAAKSKRPNAPSDGSKNNGIHTTKQEEYPSRHPTTDTTIHAPSTPNGGPVRSQRKFQGSLSRGDLGPTQAYSLDICKKGLLLHSLSLSLSLSPSFCIQLLQTLRQRERENYAEKGGNPFLHMLREWTLT